MVSPSRYRTVLLVVLLIAVAVLADGYTAYGRTTIGHTERAIEEPMAAREPVVPPADGITVVTARGFEDHDRSAAVLAFAPDGRPIYFDNSLDAYWDVDVLDEAGVVVYTGRTDRGGETVNVVERLDLRTGEVERLYASRRAGAWQSLAVINETHVVVGDADDGRAFVVDTARGAVEWEWFDGPYLGDDGWIHDRRGSIRLNDVAATPDGRVIVNLHVRDQALFVRPGRGIVADWTVGENMNHRRLYHQHDVDYVPAANGGPSTVFADAGNDRLVEYHRRNGRWVRSWTWTDPRLDDPADVDRLSGGRTLVANAGGDEVFVVSRSGTVTWQATVPHPTDVERLETTANSSHGTHSDHGEPRMSAAAAGIESRQEPSPPWQIPLGHYMAVGLGWLSLDGVVDAALPAPMDEEDLPPLAALLSALGAWLLLEAWWYAGRPLGSSLEEG